MWPQRRESQRGMWLLCAYPSPWCSSHLLPPTHPTPASIHLHPNSLTLFSNLHHLEMECSCTLIVQKMLGLSDSMVAQSPNKSGTLKQQHSSPFPSIAPSQSRPHSSRRQDLTQPQKRPLPFPSLPFCLTNCLSRPSRLASWLAGSSPLPSSSSPSSSSLLSLWLCPSSACKDS